MQAEGSCKDPECSFYRPSLLVVPLVASSAGGIVGIEVVAATDSQIAAEIVAVDAATGSRKSAEDLAEIGRFGFERKDSDVGAVGHWLEPPG